MSVSYLQLKVIAELCGGVLAPSADVGLSEDHFVPKDPILVILLLIEEFLEVVAVVVVFGRGHLAIGLLNCLGNPGNQCMHVLSHLAV